MKTIGDRLYVAVLLPYDRQMKIDELAYRQFLQANPDHALAWRHLGGACHAQGKLDEAVANYRQALRLHVRTLVTGQRYGYWIRRMSQPVVQGAVVGRELRVLVHVQPPEIVLAHRQFAQPPYRN